MKSALKLMYTALMQISFALYTRNSLRAKEICGEAISEMNSKHTKLVQEILGIK